MYEIDVLLLMSVKGNVPRFF